MRADEETRFKDGETMKVWLQPTVYMPDDETPILICSLKQLEEIYKQQPELEVWIKDAYPYLKPTDIKLVGLQFTKRS